jgi:Family of unknown function (DUF6502)
VTDGIKAALRQALIRILRPLVQWLLEVGFSASEFIDLVKVVYIDAASSRLLEDPGPQAARRRQKGDTQMAISSVTGISRTFIRKYQTGDWSLEAEDAKAGGHRASRVLEAWWHNPKWHTPQGRPAKLPLTGGRRSFNSLCKESSGEHRAHYAILADLLRVGAARVVLEEDRKYVELLSRTYATVNWSEASIAEMGEAVGSHIETWSYNFLNPDTPLICRSEVTYNTKRQAEGILRNQLRTQLESTFDIAHRLLHNPMHAVPSDVSAQPGNTLGIHCFMIRREASPSIVQSDLTTRRTRADKALSRKSRPGPKDSNSG